MSKIKKVFSNKTAVVTGAGSGIGRELAIQLSSYCESIVLLDINKEAIEETSNLCECNTYPGVVDLRSREATLKFYSKLPSDFLPDFIFANAGLGGINPGNAFSVDADRKIMEVNYFGTIHTVHPFIEKMINRGSGHIVGVSSLASMRGMPAAASYSASKAAQANLLESWRLDLKPFGIKVSTILPGFIKTPMTNHKEFDMPFMVSVPNCAKKILNSVAKNKKVTMFPFPMKLLSLLNKVLPPFLFDWIMPIASGGEVKKEAKIF